MQFFFSLKYRVQPTADRVAQSNEINSINFQFSTRRTMGLIISTILLRGTNRKSHGQNSGLLTKF